MLDIMSYLAVNGRYYFLYLTVTLSMTKHDKHDLQLGAKFKRQLSTTSTWASRLKC